MNGQKENSRSFPDVYVCVLDDALNLYSLSLSHLQPLIESIEREREREERVRVLHMDYWIQNKAPHGFYIEKERER